MDLTDAIDSTRSGDSDLLDDGEEIRYEIDEGELQHIHDIASARHGSYDDGRTRNEDWANDSYGSMVRGVAGELLAALAYEEFEFDDSVSSCGDSGLDGALDIGGERQTVDVKTTGYDHNSVSLLVAKPHLEQRPETPDVFVAGYFDGDDMEIRLRGWISTDDLCSEEYLKSGKGDWFNYGAEVRSDAVRPMPTPDSDEVEIVRG